MGHSYLKGQDGDCVNVILATPGYKISLLIRWFEALLRAPIAVILSARRLPQTV